MTSLVYSTGTVSVSNASAIVTGTGTSWAVALVTGGMFSFAGLSVPIASVESDTSLTLAYPWPGATASGAYAIARETSEAVRAAWINDRMARFMTKPWGTGVVPDGRGTLAERDALSPMPTDKYCWLREETSFDPTLYFKTSSGWIGPYPLVGEQGPAGVGVGGYGLPAGGTTGQVPTKSSGVDGAVAWADPSVPDNAITYAKMQNVSATARVLGRKTAGAGDPEELTISDVLDMVGSAAEGDLLFRGAAGWARLPKGAIGQYLRQNTALTAPEWVTVPQREVLTGNRTYYVRTDGNNSNAGLVNTAGGALLTLQAAWNKVAALDLSTFAVTIKVADGTYTSGISMTSMPVGGSSITIEGNTTTPGNCYLNMTTTNFQTSAPLPTSMNIKGFKLRFAGSNANAVYMTATGTITTSNMELVGGSTGFTGAYNAAERGARIIVSSGQLISGGMSCFVQAAGGEVQLFSITVTLTGTPAFSWNTAVANNGGIVTVAGVIFSGAATGARYYVLSAGGINTGGAGANYLPGNAAGTVSSPGWYL